MTEIKPFEKQFIYRDEERIAGTTLDYQRSLDRVSDVFPKVEKVIKRKLTDEERVDLAHNKAIILLDILRPEFPFPKADDDFNLKALGVNINPLLDELRSLPGIYCQTSVVNQRLTIAEGTLNEIENANTQYTQNENQNKALELAKKLIAGFDEVESMGLLDNYGKNRIDLVTKLLHTPIGSGGKISPNKNTIRDIQ